MFNPILLETVAQSQQIDRLREAEIARMLIEGRDNSSSQKTKLTVVLSGTVLVVLMIAQML